MKELKEVEAGLRAELKRQGYSAKGRSFRWIHPSGNSQLLAVQRSTKSTAAETLFTINYGVYSARIGRWLEDDANAAGDVACAHWRCRIRDDGRERWFSVAANCDVGAISSEVIAYATQATADLERHGTDEALRDEWLTAVSPGITEMQCLVYLAILLHEIGPRSRLPEVLDSLRSLVEGKPQEGSVRRKLGRIWEER